MIRCFCVSITPGTRSSSATIRVAFLTGLLRGAIRLRQPQHSWEHISKSAQRLKIGPGAIIRAIMDGRLFRVGNLEGRTGYAAVYVDHDEVARLFGSDAPPGYTIETFAKSIGAHPPAGRYCQIWCLRIVMRRPDLGLMA